MKTKRQLGQVTWAEISSFLSVRSLTGLFPAGSLAIIVLGWRLEASAKASWENGYDASMVAQLPVFATLHFGQLLFAAAVILQVTGEYSANQIGSTLQAVTRRGVLLCAKSIVVVVVGFLGGVLAIGLGTIPAALGTERFGVFPHGDLVSSALGAGDTWSRRGC